MRGAACNGSCRERLEVWTRRRDRSVVQPTRSCFGAPARTAAACGALRATAAVENDLRYGRGAETGPWSNRLAPASGLQHKKTAVACGGAACNGGFGGGAGENGVERTTSALQSFQVDRELWRTPAPRTPRRTSARFPGHSASTGRTRRSRGIVHGLLGSARPVSRTRFPRSTPSHFGSLSRCDGIPGLWPVLRVCTHDPRADGVHPQRLSWVLCPPVLGAWPRALRRCSLGTDRHPWARAVGGCIESAGPRAGPMGKLGGGCRCAPFQSFDPRSDGCRSPGPCPLVVGEAALLRCQASASGVCPPTGSRNGFWRNLRMLS